MLVYPFPFLVTPAKLLRTDIAHAIPLTLVAGRSHMSRGNADLPHLGTPLVGAVPRIIIGSRLTLRVNDRYVRNAIAFVLAVVRGKLLSQR